MSTAAVARRHDLGVITPSAPWPFVGRSRELASALAALADPASAGTLLVGPAGVGKTRLLDEVAAELGRRGRQCHRAVGSAATQEIPFAAVAHLLPPNGPSDPTAVFVELGHRWRTAAEEGARHVLVVDDVGLLDTASLALCTHLVNAGIAALLATSRAGEPLPTAVTSLERTQHVDRLEIGPFDVDGVIEVLEAVQGGTVDRRTSRALWQASQGNLLYLRELVLGALASGAMVSSSGAWRLVAPLAATSKLVEAVTGRLEVLPGDARELAELLALTEPQRVDDLEAAGFGEAALVLDDAGLLAAADLDGATVVRLSHPLHGEVLRAQLTRLRRRSLLLRAAAAVDAAGRPQESLRLASWLTAAGAPVDPAILRDGAHRARMANDFALTERLARAAVEREPDLDMLVLLAEAVYEFGRIDEADQTLALAVAHVRSDLDRLRVSVLHHRVLLWGRGDADGSLAVLRAAAAYVEADAARVMLRLSEANTVVFGDEPAATFAVLDGGPDGPLPGAMAAHARAIALCRLGDPVAAIAVLEAAWRELGPAPVASRVDDVNEALLLLNAEAMARTCAGDLAGAETAASRAYGVVVDQVAPQLHAWISLSLGRVALERGRLVEARRWFAEALAVAVDNRFAPGRRMALTGLAACAGQVGDVHAAAALLAEIDGLAPDLGFFAPQVELGRAWCLVALGRTTDAVAALRAGASRAAASGDETLRGELLYEAARVGGEGAAWAELSGTDVTGALAAARRRFVEGLATDDRALLLAAEEDLAALGADLAAAEAAYALAARLELLRRPREASAAAARGADHLGRAGDACTPLLQLRPSASTLTPREREIASLAATGLASKAIARQLGVTERTVSNHLQNAYVKLGISNRGDLADALSS